MTTELANDVTGAPPVGISDLLCRLEWRDATPSESNMKKDTMKQPLNASKN